ncbi:MAG TPA: PilZ domain-containing protein [Sphingomicrobium sp.]|nr:PilZ domain-containing protein [Sphingomicrobium sp.]
MSQDPRRGARIGLSAEITLRRAGQSRYRVKILDASTHGCKAEFVERPELDEHVWVKFEGLEALEAFVCWVRGTEVGLEFERPIHPAVFEGLVSKLAK